MEQNICCKDGGHITFSGEINTLNVNCCCKCGNNGGEDKPEPPTAEPSEKNIKL